MTFTLTLTKDFNNQACIIYNNEKIIYRFDLCYDDNTIQLLYDNIIIPFTDNLVSSFPLNILNLDNKL